MYHYLKAPDESFLRRRGRLSDTATAYVREQNSLR